MLRLKCITETLIFWLFVSEVIKCRHYIRKLHERLQLLLSFIECLKDTGGVMCYIRENQSIFCIFIVFFFLNMDFCNFFYVSNKPRATQVHRKCKCGILYFPPLRNLPSSDPAATLYNIPLWYANPLSTLMKIHGCGPLKAREHWHCRGLGSILFLQKQILRKGNKLLPHDWITAIHCYLVFLKNHFKNYCLSKTRWHLLSKPTL